MYQNLYSDLVASVHARNLENLTSTSFYPLEQKGRRYWYCRGKDKNNKQVVKYLGKETPELLSAIRDAENEVQTNRQCREMVSAFLHAGFPAPARDACQILNSLAEHGFFRLRGVLIGSVAFSCYPAMFGIPKFKGPITHRTNDVDIAMFRSISVAVNDRMDKSIGECLGSKNTFEAFAEALDGFQPVLDLDNRPSSKWKNKKTGMSVDLLTPFVPPEEQNDIFLPSLRERVLKTKFLDFLIYGELPSVILFGNGIPVNVPEPGRYAIHKLIITTMRPDIGKRVKDMEQAIQLLDVLLRDDYARTLGLFEEAWNRGPMWRKRLKESVFAPRFPEKIRQEFLKIMQPECRENLGVKI